MGGGLWSGVASLYWNVIHGHELAVPLSLPTIFIFISFLQGTMEFTGKGQLRNFVD